jgi:septal ring factor EnvC (AmiA/AmiB activator)
VRRRPSAAIVVALALLGALLGAPSAAQQKPSPRTEPKAPAQRQVKPAAEATPATGASTVRRQRELRTEQQRLQSELARTKRRLAAAEASHSEATDALKESEAAISAVNKRLRELSANRRQVEKQIAALQDRSRAVAARQGAQERALGQVLRAQLVLAQQPAWHRLLDGADPQQQGQDLAYLGYMARASSQSISELQERREELAALESESRDKQAELAAIAAAEDEGRRQLLRQQAARKQTLDRLARQIGSQRQSLATLERDDRRLASLLDELGKVLDEQQRREQAAARARSEPSRPVPTPARPDPGRPATPADIDPPAGSRIAQLKGKMPLPVQGDITARFGSTRRTEAGVNAPTWKGVFIRAPQGAEVHAVAAGRVVFADWLRGFGNLLVLDHGEGLLTVYGNNETLLTNAGERVAAGEVIASVGNTGGNADPGLYFEMRFQGHPIDPLRWAAAR